MKVYLPVYTSHAGRWIYKGFQNAWNHMGYEIYAPRSVEHDYYDNSDCGNVLEIPRAGGGLEWEEDFIIMATDSLVENIGPKFFIAAERSYKTFVFVQPNTFPSPWGTHLNFQCQASDRMIATLNEMENVILWTFGDVVPDYFYKWKEVHTIHLGFDSISYNPVKDTRYNKYDICFVGGWVNNGFDEKRKIMMDIFIEFKKSGLNCGFFVNKNLSHEQENLLLYNSKISLNIHDAYQRILGKDTNERTFKSLGLNGLMISDKVTQLENLFPNVRTSNDPAALVKLTKEYLSLTEKELNDIKEESRQNVLDNHCYTNRVEQLLAL